MKKTNQLNFNDENNKKLHKILIASKTPTQTQGLTSSSAETTTTGTTRTSITSTLTTRTLQPSSSSLTSSSISVPPPPTPSISSIVSQQTPVLFSTNRGLHLRTFEMMKSSSGYNVRFCDLERWSGRTESIGLTADKSDLSREQKSANKSVRFVSEIWTSLSQDFG